MVRHAWIALLVLIVAAPLFGQPSVDPAPKYAGAVKALEAFIDHEVEDKRLPALSIALVDDQKVVWARGFGFADRERKRPATADTVYRVGSVSKLFTDIAIMQLVEKGKLDLDQNVRFYIPDFRPLNQFDVNMSLRMMMSHRAGLVREPPGGSYFHDDEISLDKMVVSLWGVPLVHVPGTKTKYSNAAIATVGYLLAKIHNHPFDQVVRDDVLGPLGMKHSDFVPRPDLIKERADAVMWTYHGREFPAPTFELGMAPAGCMYSTVNDLARFLRVLFAEGKTPSGQILKPQTLQAMLTPQFAGKDEPITFGIGFALGQLDGKKRAGHGGAVYGFSTNLAFLPAEKLGVIVIASRDGAGPVVTRIADTALRQMLAARDGKPLPAIPTTTRPKPEEARQLGGRYASGSKSFDLIESNGRLWMLPSQGGPQTELRKDGDNLFTDGVLGVGTRIERVGEKLRIDKDDYSRIAVEKPPPCPKHLQGLIGEYGWDHNTLFIFEKDGKLHCNVHWFYVYPLTEEAKDVFSFPEIGLFSGEKLVFKRDEAGKAAEVEVASVLFKRRPIDGEDGKTFRIKPVRPVEELRTEAAKATPPPEKGKFRTAELIDVTTLDKSIKLDLRYAGDNNFMSVPLYPATAKAYLQKPAAEALAQVNEQLKKKGYGLLIHDAYRPWMVTKMFWDATPEKWHHFVADPSKGSRHNRGCAVDLTLYDLKTGKPVEMVGGFDEFSDRSYPDYLGGTSLQRWHRNLLRTAMESNRFTVYEAEWWHYDFEDWGRYAIGNQSFEELEKK